MSATRYVVLGLAHPRARWFAEVGRWANAALLPVEFVRCVSEEEVAAHIASGRRFSAALVDGGLRSLDRDLVASLAAVGAPTLVVGSLASERARALGAAAVLAEPLGPPVLLDVLEQWCRPVGVVETTAVSTGPAPVGATWRGRLVAVTGGSGSGTSIGSMALAQGLAAVDPAGARVLLADCALDAHQAVLHAAPDVVPGISELVDAHRAGTLDAEGVARLTFTDDRRGYRLMLGLRRHRDWAALRPRAVAASIETLRRSFGVVVADTDADLEGEAECGSSDVEDRNALARTVVLDADLVVVTFSTDLLGLHRCARVVHHLLDAGVDAPRVQLVATRGPTGPAARAALARSVAAITEPLHPSARHLATPVHLPSLRHLDDVLRDARPLPPKAVAPLAAAVAARLDALPVAAAPAGPTPVAVVPGSLGSWFDDESEAAGA